MRCDVTDEASVTRAVDEVVGTFGRLDGAFNNAGVGGTHRPLHETGTADFNRVLATNLRGPFLCMKYEIPAMLKAGGGSIVVTSSVGGLVGGAANTVYATSKHGLTGLVRCAALDYARAGIRVNAIAPGPTRSEMFDRWMPTEEARAAMAGHFPLNYIADPDDHGAGRAVPAVRRVPVDHRNGLPLRGRRHRALTRLSRAGRAERAVLGLAILVP